MKLPGAIRAKYDTFRLEDSLHILEGTVLDMNEVYDDLDRFIMLNEYDVRCLGFDPYNAKEFVSRWEAENGPLVLRRSFKVLALSQFQQVSSRNSAKRKLLFD